MVGDTNATFVYVAAHLRYMFDHICTLFRLTLTSSTEILKNSMKAVLEKHAKSTTLPEIVVTVCRNDKEMILRFSDQGIDLTYVCVS